MNAKKRATNKGIQLRICAVACFFALLLAGSLFAGNEIRIETTASNAAGAITAVKSALADPMCDTIVLVPSSSSVTNAIVLPANTTTEFINTSSVRKTIRVEKPFLPETGEIIVDGKNLVSPAAGEYSTYNLFKVQSTSRLIVSNITLIGGFTNTRIENYDPTAGGIENYGKLEMYNVDMLRTGTAILNRPGARVLLVECNLVRNANWFGGSILNYTASSNQNTSNRKLNYSNDGIVILDRCSLTENQSLGRAHGGGAAENQGLMCINNSIIANNASTEIGGAIDNSKGGQLYIMNSTLIGNVTTAGEYGKSAGGAIGNAARAGGVYLSNTILAYNGYDNGRGVDFSSIGRYQGSKDTVSCTMTSCIYDNYENITISSTPMSTTTYDDIFSGVEYLDVFAAGMNEGRSSQFDHPLLTTGEIGESSYAFRPVMMPHTIDHVIFANSIMTFFDYSKMWESTPTIIMAADVGGTISALGSNVQAPTGDAAIEASLVRVGFAGGLREEVNCIGAIVPPVSVEEDDDDIEQETLYWVQLGSYSNGRVSGATVYRDAYRENSIVTVRATPDSAYYVEGWTINGNLVPNSMAQQVLKLTVTENIIVAPIFAPVQTQIITARQRYPWNNLVDIDYSIAEKDAKDYRLIFTATYVDAETKETKTIQLMSFVSNSGKNIKGEFEETRIGDTDALRRAGLHRVTWDTAKDGVRIKNAKITFNLMACEGFEG